VTPFTVSPVGPAAVGLANTGRKRERVKLLRRQRYPRVLEPPTRPCATVTVSIPDTTSVSGKAAVMYSPRSPPSTSARTHTDVIRCGRRRPAFARGGLMSGSTKCQDRKAATRFELRTSTASSRRSSPRRHGATQTEPAQGLEHRSACAAAYTHASAQRSREGHQRTAGSGRAALGSADHRTGERPKRPAPPPVV
jgi:hypothetical protein